jgi:prepilin-type N-terminal cleavage/methylation domain-containing protein
MIQTTSTQSGFSLVEVLVSITILLLVITGPFQIISRSINSTNFATEQVNAWFLAQEGLELVQRGRDGRVLLNFRLQISPSLGGITDPMARFLSDYAACISTDGCGLVIGYGTTGPVSVVSCADRNDCRLYINSGTDRASYQHSSVGNTITPFTRVITMEVTRVGGPATNVREIKVTSTVTWRTGSLISSQEVTAETYLFNIYDTI